MGTYYNPFTPPRLVVGSNKFLSWEVKDWNSEHKKYARIEKNHLRYGRVLVAGEDMKLQNIVYG